MLSKKHQPLFGNKAILRVLSSERTVFSNSRKNKRFVRFERLVFVIKLKDFLIDFLKILRTIGRPRYANQ